ncbi:uncharacterized protein J8A68_002233 [[Candida] subhashii]|uniref:Major facilitator superfamily (MFS) profile domain-containing protein n=1 Tax=[Candida] subhashii TaxID=561895 RepID=A0A8J5V190_9ASCO|nr:uncharacterized protein J8A68_002233 [[Candida] subhashii]KAG7664219.1 hypothetical protein J8A68_002233 [[Candida] subhashii]
MIRDFNIAKDPADIATYSGYLSAAFSFFQFLCCVQWGKASDSVGRKRILLCGLVGTAFSMLLFGFSPNFYMAMFARCLMGCLNGNISVMRTAIGEVATERRHQGIAFTSYSLLWNIGAVLGPMIGGSKYLTRPKSREDDLDDGSLIARFFMNTFENSGNDNAYERFLNKFPYALSNIVVASFLAFSFIMGFLFLEEPNERFKHRKDIGLEIGDFILRRLGFEVPVRPWKRGNQNVREETPLINDTPEELYATTLSDDEDDASISSFVPVSRKYSSAVARRYSSNQLGPVISNDGRSILTTNIPQSFSRDIFTPAVIQSIVSNFLICFHNVIYSEFLPVLLAAELLPKELEFPFKIVGGFGYDNNMIGNLLSSTGLIAAFGILILYPYIERNVKTINILRFSSIFYPIAYFILPYLVFTRSQYNPENPEWLTKLLLYLVCSLYACAASIGFPTILVLLHRASPAKHRAFINGTTLSMTSLSRFVGPISWGYFIAYSDRKEVAELSWFVLGVVACGCCLQNFYMSDHEEEDEEHNHNEDEN